MYVIKMSKMFKLASKCFSLVVPIYCVLSAVYGSCFSSFTLRKTICYMSGLPQNKTKWITNLN